MKWLLLIMIISIPAFSYSQEIPVATEQELENLVQKTERSEDDQLLQDLDDYRNHKLNLNYADKTELSAFRLLSELQIESLISYRNLFGKILSIYELQAIPGWDPVTIRRLLPYISVESTIASDEIGDLLRAGEHNLILRFSTAFEKPDPGLKWLGSPYKLLLRHRYKFKNFLQYGFTGDKDAGEQFFQGAQKQGFDFYSIHFFARVPGKVKAFALGDYTVNLGQGLISWQAMSFGKSGEITSVKNQSEEIRPYTSSGEFYFSRGVAVSAVRKKFQFTVFFSGRKLTANMITDSSSGHTFFSSVINSGFHRSFNEVADKGKLKMVAYGGAVHFISKKIKLGLNGIRFQYSSPQRKQDEPYNLFSIRHRGWMNLSFDYSVTCKNFHFFGETAIDKLENFAVVNGVIAALDSRVDFAVLQRKISERYQAPYANAFTESSIVNNETGIYTGLTIRPVQNLKLDFYIDLFSFPWLKFQVDHPSSGKEFYFQVTYTPNKQVSIISRVKSQLKNSSLFSFRNHIGYQLNRSFAVRKRIEMLWIEKNEHGFLAFADLIYNPLAKPAGILIRASIYETSSYTSRIYGYENDVLYGGGVRPNFGKGCRTYIIADYKLGRNQQLWIKLSHSFVKSGSTSSTEARIQWCIRF